jgi:hypothetical protein
VTSRQARAHVSLSELHLTGVTPAQNKGATPTVSPQAHCILRKCPKEDSGVMLARQLSSCGTRSLACRGECRKQFSAQSQEQRLPGKRSNPISEWLSLAAPKPERAAEPPENSESKARPAHMDGRRPRLAGPRDPQASRLSGYPAWDGKAISTLPPASDTATSDPITGPKCSSRSSWSFKLASR